MLEGILFLPFDAGGHRFIERDDDRTRGQQGGVFSGIVFVSLAVRSGSRYGLAAGAVTLAVPCYGA